MTPMRPSKSKLYPWYDSVWLTKFTKAKAIIRRVRPEALDGFVDAFHVFQTKPDFKIRRFERIFDDDTMNDIRRAVSSLRPADLELHEARMFGRFIVHDHKFFTELQQRTIALVSEATGEPVEASYNFLSLYSSLGRCPVHMDSPEAKWTLDLCVDQSVAWPIYFSKVNPWPDSDGKPWPEDWEAQIKNDSALDFTAHTLQPGEAVVFSGSSQWHYREPIQGVQGRQFCDLLFFHYIPAGTSELVRPENWARLFDIPDLAEITAQRVSAG